MEFEPAIPASERPQTHALDCSTTGIGIHSQFLLLLARQPPPPPVGHGLPILEVSRSHSTTHHSRQDFSGRVISPSHRPLPDNTHKTQTSMLPVGFEPTISAGERPQTFALDRKATGTGTFPVYLV